MALRHFAAQAATALRVRCVPQVHPGFGLPHVRLMSTVLDTLKYARSHEWVKVEEDVAFVGITDHAQHELGDVVHVEVKAGINEDITKGNVFAVVESVKAASDVYAPISGTIIEINGTLDGSKSPELVNTSPFEAGWFAKVRVKDPSELNTLLSAKAYEEHIAASEH